MTTKKGERAALVTTLHKGVFFGYATNTDGKTIKLRAARCCIYWPTVPPKWKGERLWVVALIGEVQEDGDKLGALCREIIGECV